MMNIECELCEIDSEVVLCDGAIMELTPEMLPTIAEIIKTVMGAIIGLL